MIKRLELKNIALINHAIIDFEKGLNVLSGETGSGKSVIVDSINFVLGAKADKSMIRYGESECYASVLFDVENNQTVKDILEELGCEVEDEIIISRKFTIDSKSTIRVNGLPFTLGMLRQITSVLVDVHGQSEHYSLMKKSEQLNVLDKFSDKQLLDLKELLKIDTVLIEQPEVKEAPFGQNLVKALDYMLDLGKREGFVTKNVENVAGHIEYGEGDEVIGVLCHLDVVPTGDGWTYPPFEPTIAPLSELSVKGPV